MARENVVRLIDSETADLIFTDPPYNVPIDGNVCGLGSLRHREFAFASGEMTQAASWSGGAHCQGRGVER
jgi:DNA modification methylase